MIRDERGVTLTELLLVLAVSGMIIGVLAGAIYQISTVVSRGNSELGVQHDLQNAATWLNRDVLSASSATFGGYEETGIYTMTLVVPHLVSETILYRYVTYTYSEETEDLTRDYGGSSLIVARHISANPFTSTGTIEAPDPVTVTLRSREGNVPGTGKFALKMRAGGSITAVRLCQVTGDETLVISPTAKAVQWDITNTGATSPSIDELQITWPITDTIMIDEILFETARIWDTDLPPPSAIISEGWLGSFEDRKIISGTQKMLEFVFVSAPVGDELEYSITVTLTDNCMFSFPP